MKIKSLQIILEAFYPYPLKFYNNYNLILYVNKIIQGHCMVKFTLVKSMFQEIGLTLNMKIPYFILKIIFNIISD